MGAVPIVYRKDMEDETVSLHPGHIWPGIAELLVLAVILPVAVAFVFGYSPPPVLALIASTLVIEYGAAPVGLGLGLPWPFVLFTLCCVALGVTLFLFSAIDTLGERSERVRNFLQRSAEKGRKSRILTKYGIYGLVPCVITLGFYICPPVAGVFGWKRNLSILMIMAGYTGAAIATTLLTLGIFNAFSG